MSTSIPDETLAANWAKGDRSAGQELFSRYFAPLVRFMAGKLPRDSDACEDLVAKVFLALVENPGGFRNEGSYRGYLYGIARKILLRWFRDRARKPQHEAIGELSLVELEPTLSSVMAKQQRTQQVGAAVSKLPLDLQITLELHFWEHLTVAELAQVLELPLGTAKTRLRRAKLLLAAALLENH